MLAPGKHEDLKLNLLVLGADLLRILKKQSEDIESLFTKLRREKDVTIDVFFDTVLFLWLSDAIEIDEAAVIRSRRK